MHDINTVSGFLKTVNVYTLVNNEDVYNRFMEYYQYTFNHTVNCGVCPNDIEQAIHKLNWMVKLHIKNNNTVLMKADKVCRYSMKPNVRFFSNSLGIMVTRFNCTDAIAEALIKENPVNANLFTVNTPEVNEGAEVIEVIDKAEPVTNLAKPVKQVAVKKVVKQVEAETVTIPIVGIKGEYGQIPPHPKGKKGRAKEKTKRK